MKSRWIYRDGKAFAVDETYGAEPVAPMVMPDIKPYQSMIDGREISSRSRHREHLRAHGVIEVGNEKLGPRKIAPPPGLKDTIIRIANERLR